VRRLDDISENFDRKRKPISKSKRAERQGIHPYYGAAKIFDYLDDYIFDGEYLLMAEDGSVITPDQKPVLQLATGKFWANNHTHILRGTTVSTHFLYLALLEVNVSGYITGAAQPKITQANMNRIPFVCGPASLHERFDCLVEPLVRMWQTLDRRNENLRRTRDLLLPKLLQSG
jgi:type I restriction enzyme S subunit